MLLNYVFVISLIIKGNIKKSRYVVYAREMSLRLEEALSIFVQGDHHVYDVQIEWRSAFQSAVTDDLRFTLLLVIRRVRRMHCK